jgi:uncharacterized protein
LRRAASRSRATASKCRHLVRRFASHRFAPYHQAVSATFRLTRRRLLMIHDPRPIVIESGGGSENSEYCEDPTAICRACGACCSFSAEWPRFALEDDAALDQIPSAFIDRAAGRMRCHGERCAALEGRVGVSTSCAVYAIRPDVCRDCLPGDAACHMARHRFNLPRLSVLAPG